MLDLTNTEAEIIKVFIDHYRDKSNKITNGISADELEKYGIVSKTFRNHKDYFLKNYFLRLNAVGYHGPRHYFYFQITNLGVLAYLKWQSKLKLSDIWLDHDFFPLLFKYWEELVESFDPIFADVITKTMNRIDIRPEYEAIINGEKLSGGKLEESIIIPMGMIEVKIFRKYKQPELQEKPTENDVDRIDTFDSLNKVIDDKINDRFTFLLLFNLLHLGTSVGELTNLYLRNCIEYDQKGTKKQSEEEIKSIFTEFHDRAQESVSKLVKIINQDKILHTLMKSSILEITNMLAGRKTLQAVYDKLD